MKVTARSGKTAEKLVLHRRGSPEDPLTPADIEYKFRHILRSCIPEERMARMLTLVLDLEKLETTHELTDLLALPTS
ncbi:hypothetical protein D3C83_90250 [compost metagenome]